jgi:hypothetical protein
VHVFEDVGGELAGVLVAGETSLFGGQFEDEYFCYFLGVGFEVDDELLLLFSLQPLFDPVSTEGLHFSDEFVDA